MSRYKKGDTVYSGRGEHLREMIVAKVHDNPLLPVYQYSFEAPNDGHASGEQSLRDTPDGRDLKISECWKDGKTNEDVDNDVATRINTIMSAKRNTVSMEDWGLGNTFKDCNLFFKPDLEFVEWLRDYADGRLIIDVGSGQGHLVRMLKMVKAKAMGLEPNLDKEAWIKARMIHDGEMRDINEILAMTVEEAKGLIGGMGADNVLLVFARPCHSDFVQNGIYNMPSGMEALYITVPENLERYNDLGIFQSKATLVEHEGISEDEEIVYSVIRK